MKDLKTFTRAELLEIKDQLQSSLENVYMGDYRGVDLALARPDMFDMGTMTVLRWQSILSRVRDVGDVAEIAM